jgi:hypothetical protein
MLMYFSGVGGKEERAILREAGATHVLADIFDYAGIADWPGRKILDSGEYRRFKQGAQLPSIDEYIAFASDSSCEWFLQQDVIGDPAATWQNWLLMQHAPKCMPVYQWGSDPALMQQILATCGERPIAIGGLVMAMRAHDEQMLAELVTLCQTYPGRFHILGMAWTKAIEAVRWLARSGDSSMFMTGGRHAMLVFENTSARLIAVPFRAIPEAAGWDRRTRCLKNAQALQAYCNQGALL